MIRKGRVEDIPLIMNLIKDAVNDMESKGVFQWDSLYPNEEIISFDVSNGCLYVYEDSGYVKGIVVLNEYQDKEYEEVNWEYNSGKQLVVHRLCILPKYQSQGIARCLIEFAGQHGKREGYSSIRLDTFVYNKRACNLYERSGYKVVGTVYFRKGKFYCFEKKL